MALGTGEYDTITVPAAYPLSMAAKIPVSLTIGMTGTANEVRSLESDLLVPRIAQKIHVIAVMAGQAPEPVAAVINFLGVPGLEPTRFGIGVSFFMAPRTGLKFRFLVAPLNGECGGLGVKLIFFLVRLELCRGNQARCANRENNWQPSQHYCETLLHVPGS
jgi:hypothetical protein